MVTVLFLFVFCLGLFFSLKGNKPKNRRNYIISMVVVLTLHSCLRGLSVGSDTSVYHYMYTEIFNTSWADIWQSFVERYIHFKGTDDVGFLIYQKLISYISHDFSFYLFVSALIFFIPFARLLYKHTKNFTQLIFIFCLYVALFTSIALSGVRKEVALGLSLLAFMYYAEKKYKKMFIAIFIGGIIHLSILLFFIIPIIDYFDFKKIRAAHLVSFLLIPFVIVSSGFIIVSMGEFVGNEKYTQYGMYEAQGGGIVFTVFIELISLVCYIAYSKKWFEKENFEHKLYCALPCFTFFAPLITNNGSMIRISQYFHIYILLLFPYAIDYLFKKKSKTVYFVLCVILCMLAISTNTRVYTFIWEDSIPNF